MDRFIAFVNFHEGFSSTYLKSNMDRFIVAEDLSNIVDVGI